MIHEMSHTIGHLADEYWYGEGDTIAESVNTTNKTTPPWNSMVGYEGIGKGYSIDGHPTGVKPSEYCRMTYIDRGFCAVCRKQLLAELEKLRGEAHESEKQLQEIYVSTNAYKGVTYKASSLKTSSKTFTIKAKAYGTVTYKVTAGTKYVSVSSTGKVTVKRNTPKGTYKVQLTAAGNSKYLKATKTVRITVK